MSRDRKMINLTRQGGGAHGAFGWGVLDALQERGRTAAQAWLAAHFKDVGKRGPVAIRRGSRSDAPL